MIIEFELEGRAFSVNKAYYATRKVLTAEAKAWQAEIAAQLEELKCLSEFALEFKDTPGPIELRVTFYIPHHVFYNAQGQISVRSQDLDNGLKLLIDLIFRHMSINDINIVKIVAQKQVGARYSIGVRLSLL